MSKETLNGKDIGNTHYSDSGGHRERSTYWKAVTLTSKALKMGFDALSNIKGEVDVIIVPRKIKDKHDYWKQVRKDEKNQRKDTTKQSR